ncbi:hypothetical protein NKR23_g4762 [Pleurostoma richardsiae]|uniref:Uncharacterized protein n=1 Tax=Pleurostoma richardsiae TaxID=41990 RepID=A0AA38RHF6_9PEZI|nr:hypothetical protein NKR23_g4762 [Pleurostoma richardsiae]
MAAHKVVKYMAASKKSSATAALLVHCQVKPGTNKAREGISSVTDDVVEICVAAHAREGEANKAVLKLLGAVLGVPKSDLRITHGVRSREKTISVEGKLVREFGPDSAARVRRILEFAVDGSTGQFGASREWSEAPPH